MAIRVTRNSSLSPFQSALEKLERLFAGALHDAKFNSCHSAWAEIKRSKSAKKRIETLSNKFHEWREITADAIRECLPRFVDLANAYPQIVRADPVHFARDKAWKIVEGMCGVQEPSVSESEDNDSSPVVNDIMLYWFAVASEGNLEVLCPPLRPWSAPRWLESHYQDTGDLLQKHNLYLRLRVNCAIEEAADLAWIQMSCRHDPIIAPLERDSRPPERTRAEQPRRSSKKIDRETDFTASQDARDRRKPGHKPKLTQSFVIFTGGLWREARCEGKSNVSEDQLRRIASALDAEEYLPPSAFLEGEYSRELRDFNRRNSNSRIGPIRTWSQLVSRGDKDHLRGMRRLLYRCAQKLARPSLSGN